MARGYPIPKATRRVEYRQGNSRFLATISPAATVAEAREFIQSIRDEMPDATHHVYAMKVGYGASVTEGMSDDGEPSGTSGPPALAVLRGADLGDVVLVITRFFGGTKLGTGGLVTAYSTAAALAVEGLETVRKIARERVGFAISYHHFERVKMLLAEKEVLVEREEFGADVEIEAMVPVDEVDALELQLRNLTAGRTSLRRER